MGVKDIIQKFTKKKNNDCYSMTGTPTRVYTARDVWGCDTVQQAVGRIVTELLKYKPTHTRKEQMGEEYPVDGGLQWVLEHPNEWDTGVDLFEKLYYQYFLHGNAYMVPEYIETQSGARRYTALHVINPQVVEHVEDNEGHQGYLFKFANGYEIVLPCSDVIHIKRQYAKNEFFGGDINGRPDTNALQATVEMNDKLLEGVQKTVESGYSVRGVLKLSGQVNQEKQREIYKDFIQKINAGNSGFIVMDAKSELQELSKGTPTIDQNTLDFIDKKLVRTFGVSQAILDGDFTQDQLQAFQTIAVDPVIQKIEAEMTKKMFTYNEYCHGNRIHFYHDGARYVDQTTQNAIQMLREPGAITQNELRVALGMRPLKGLSTDENGKPIIMMSKNWGSMYSVKDQVTLEAGEAEYTNQTADKQIETENKQPQTTINNGEK